MNILVIIGVTFVVLGGWVFWHYFNHGEGEEGLMACGLCLITIAIGISFATQFYGEV